MTTISLFDQDQSEHLARRFALQVTTYFNTPEAARELAARVPLENLFRMLQMFRYDAFSDERRGGILELEGFEEEIAITGEEGVWHQKIEAALNTALTETFGNVPKDEAMGEVQSALRWLATNKDAPPEDAQTRSQSFLERFVAALA